MLSHIKASMCCCYCLFNGNLSGMYFSSTCLTQQLVILYICLQQTNRFTMTSSYPKLEQEWLLR